MLQGLQSSMHGAGSWRGQVRRDRCLHPPAQAGTGRFWELWSLFDMPGLSLQRIHVRAALQQVGKVGGGAAAAPPEQDGRQRAALLACRWPFTCLCILSPLAGYPANPVL